jgi:hypothetical protein
MSLNRLTLPAGQSLTINSVEEFDSIDVYGSLTLLANITLHGNFNVMPGGSLDVQDAFIKFIVDDDTKFIGGDSVESRNDTGLWIEGKCQITGMEKTPWVNMFPDGAIAGDNYGIVRQVCTNLGSPPKGWLENDSYVCISPDGTVAPCKYGEWKGMSFRYRGVIIVPRVVNLTRTAGVHGGDVGHKPHIMALHHGQLTMYGAEVVNCGPAVKLGRYPIHLHHTHHASVIDGSSIYSTSGKSNRGIAIHDTPNNVIRNNVLCDVLGHAVFMEDPKGNEVGNQVIGNTTINVGGDAKGLEVVPTPEDAIYKATAHYWVRPGNTVRGNVACGGTAVGFVNMPGKGGTEATSEDCQAWGVGRYGFQSGTPIELKNSIAVNCDVAGYASTEKWGLTDEGSVISDPVFLLNGEKPDAPFITATDKAYISQVYLNTSRKLTIKRGILAGKKGIHTHYLSNVETFDTEINVDVGFTPTYYESPITINGGSLTTKALADAPYAPRAGNKFGPIRLKGVNWNGKVVDKTYVSKSLATFYKLPVLSVEKDPFGRVDGFGANEIPNQEVK